MNVSSDTAKPSVRPWRVAAPWVIAGLLLASVVVASATLAPPGTIRVGPSVGVAHVTPSAVSDPVVNVSLTDAPSFQPDAIAVPSGSNVTFHLMNVGRLSHSFTLARQPNVTLDPAWSPSQLDAYFAGNGSLANQTLAGGSNASVAVDFAGAASVGRFEFVSVVPYQFQAGMLGFVTVTPSAGGNATTLDNTTDALAFVPQNLYVGTTAGMHFPIVIHVQVINLGGIPHTFTVAPQTNVTVTVANFTSYFVQHAPLTNVTVPTGSGNFIWANFTMSGPGVYMFICEEPGHFAAGMYGFLYVDVPLPSPATPTTGIFLVGILAGAGGLVVVGIVLAVIGSYGGRFPPKTDSPPPRP